MDSVFQLEIATPERIFFTGEVQSIIVEALDGQMEIQKGHIPAVVSLVSGVIRIKKDGAWINASCASGFMEIRPEKTVILVQTAELPEEIDSNRARRSADEAAEALRQRQSIREFKESKAALARAMARLRVVEGKHINIE